MNATTAPCPTLYRSNLAALRAFQPDIADAVDSVSIPDSTVETVGRDGSRTFLLRDDTGLDVWFGRSSMPRISAEAIFAALQPDGGNAWLPGIVTGLEPLVITDRLPPHCALFVLEPEPLFIKLALFLHDYTPLIAAGRLVFILARDLDQSLRRFFERYGGYEAPRRLLTVPHLTAAQVGALQRQIEDAMQHAQNLQTAALQQTADALRTRQPSEIPPQPRVAVLSADPTPAVTVQAARVARALTALGWSHRVCVPDAPGKCHIVARMRTIEQCNADVVVVLGDGARWLRPLLPPQLPLLTWSVPGCPPPPVPAQPAPRDVCFATAQSAADQWRAAGLDAHHLAICEPAADAGAPEMRQRRGRSNAPQPFHVAILMDLPDTRAAACGITLQSHRTLWDTLHAVAADAVENASENVEAWLRDAEQRTGVTLADPDVRRMFVALIQSRLAPAALAQALLRAAASVAVDLSVWGTNWTIPDQTPAVHAGPIPLGPRLFHAVCQAHWIVLPDCSDRSVQIALDALAAGTCVTLRGDPHEFATQYPGLTSLVEALAFFHRPRQLRNHLHNHRPPGSPTPPSPPEADVDAVSARVRRHHATAARLAAMIQRVRRMQPNAGPARAATWSV